MVFTGNGIMVLFTCNIVAIVDFIACCMVVNRLVCLTEPIRNEYISIHYKIERTKRQTIVCKHYTKY
jgi:hypothetical protein